jgi:hypothetical protein
MRMMVAAVLFLGVAGPAQAGELTAQEIRTELVGQTIVWWETDGWHAGDLTLRPDGRARITVEKPHAAAESGRWSIEGNRICTQWISLRAGSAKCYSVTRVSEGRFVTSGGNVFELRQAGA